jgi:hypothetical protein
VGWATLGIASLLLITSCGGDDKTTDSPSSGEVVTTTVPPSAPAVTTPDPCGLVTVEEVSAALGSPIGTPEGTTLSPPIGGRSCLFSNTDAPPVKTFQIVVRTDADLAKSLREAGQSVEKLFDDTKNLSQPVEEVDLGDRAYRSTRGYSVLVHGVSLETNLGLNSDPSAEAEAALTDLTQKVVARLR